MTLYKSGYSATSLYVQRGKRGRGVGVGRHLATLDILLACTSISLSMEVQSTPSASRALRSLSLSGSTLLWNGLEARAFEHLFRKAVGRRYVPHPSGRQSPRRKAPSPVCGRCVRMVAWQHQRNASEPAKEQVRAFLLGLCRPLGCGTYRLRLSDSSQLPNKEATHTWVASARWRANTTATARQL